MGGAPTPLRGGTATDLTATQRGFGRIQNVVTPSTGRELPTRRRRWRAWGVIHLGAGEVPTRFRVRLAWGLMHLWPGEVPTGPSIWPAWGLRRLGCPPPGQLQTTDPLSQP